ARHLAAGRHLAFYLRWAQRFVERGVTLCQAACVHIGALDAGIVHRNLRHILRIVRPTRFISPGADAARAQAAAVFPAPTFARETAEPVAVRTFAGALALAPALARGNGLLCALQ